MIVAFRIGIESKSAQQVVKFNKKYIQQKNPQCSDTPNNLYLVVF